MLLLLACISPEKGVGSELVTPLPDRRPGPELDTGEVIVPPDDTGEDSGDPEVTVPKVVINEIMTNNASYADDYGDLSDWVEIYNADTQSFPLSQIMLTDSSGQAWLGPVGDLAPGEHYIIYADGGASHYGAPFALSSSGDELTLLVNGIVTDRMATGQLNEDVAWARIPDGGTWEPTVWITRGEPNGDEASPDLDTSPFNIHHLYDINIGLSSASYSSLTSSPTTYTEAELTIDGMILDPVGVRLRGAYTYLPMGNKAGFKVSLSKFADYRYRGLKKFDLLNMMAYYSGVKDFSIYEVARYVGVPAPRNSYAKVAVNGDPYGVYLFHEDYDDPSWIKDTFGSKDGVMIWEPNYGDINISNFSYWDCEYGTCDTSKVTRVGDILNGSATDENINKLDQYLDLDNTLMMMAIEMAVGDWDGYCASHNYRVVYDPATDRISLLLASMDLTISGATPAMTGCNSGKVYQFCQQNASCQDRWKATLIKLADGIEEMDLISELEQVRELIGDEYVAQTKRPVSKSQFDTEFDQVEAYWAALPDYLRTQAR